MSTLKHLCLCAVIDYVDSQLDFAPKEQFEAVAFFSVENGYAIETKSPEKAFLEITVFRESLTPELKTFRRVIVEKIPLFEKLPSDLQLELLQSAPMLDETMRARIRCENCSLIWYQSLDYIVGVLTHCEYCHLLVCKYSEHCCGHCTKINSCT